MVLNNLKKLEAVKHLALDMDGTIYSGNTLFPYTKDFFKRIKKLGVGYTFLTNNSSRSVKQYLEKINNLGLEADENQLYISSLASIEFIKSNYPEVKRLFILGTDGLKSDFSASGFEIINNESDKPDLVVVGFDTGLNFDNLNKTSYWISKGVPYIATHPDAVCPTDQPTLLVDCGAICAAIETATHVKPIAVPGKPNPLMIKGILSKHGLHNNELGMVGDRLYTDIAMANRAGIIGILVLSGETNGDSLNMYTDKPDVVVPTLRELADLLEKAKLQEKQ